MLNFKLTMIFSSFKIILEPDAEIGQKETLCKGLIVCANQL